MHWRFSVTPTPTTFLTLAPACRVAGVFRVVGILREINPCLNVVRCKACQMKNLISIAIILSFNGFFFYAHQNADKRRTDRFTETMAMAEQGDMSAQNSLGLDYKLGISVTKDHTVAARWYRRAAEQGHVLAQLALGDCYFNGEGVIKDKGEAAKWYRRAAEQGYTKGQYVLGYIYFNGEGVIKDLTLAHAWLNLASAGGDEDAKKDLKKIELEMTPNQIDEATKLVRELEKNIKKER